MVVVGVIRDNLLGPLLIKCNMNATVHTLKGVECWPQLPPAPTVMGNKFEGIALAICLYLRAVMRWRVGVLRARRGDRLGWTFEEADIDRGRLKRSRSQK